MPKISRRLILNAFWNISYSEDECNVSLLVAGVAFDSI